MKRDAVKLYLVSKRKGICRMPWNCALTACTALVFFRMFRAVLRKEQTLLQKVHQNVLFCSSYVKAEIASEINMKSRAIWACHDPFQGQLRWSFCWKVSYRNHSRIEGISGGSSWLKCTCFDLTAYTYWSKVVFTVNSKLQTFRKCTLEHISRWEGGRLPSANSTAAVFRLAAVGERFQV